MHDMDLKQMSVYQKEPSSGDQSEYEGNANWSLTSKSLAGMKFHYFRHSTAVVLNFEKLLNP